MATSRRWKDQQSGEWKEETDWHNIVMWRAENVANYLLKGKQVYVEGRLQTRSYDDKDGQEVHHRSGGDEPDPAAVAAAASPPEAGDYDASPVSMPRSAAAPASRPSARRPKISTRASPTTTFRSNSALFSGPAATPLASRGLRCGLGLTELLQQFWRASPARGLGLKSFEAEDGCVQV